jgi:hypothetical protein
VHYVAIASCHAVNRPRTMNFYYWAEPSGHWWEKAKPFLNPIRIDPPESIFGNSLVRPEHVADVLRLQILIERGGVYLDLDVISIRPFAPLMEFDSVMGEEYEVGLCNAVILASPGSLFLRRWLSTYRSFDGREWNKHSVRVPYLLARQAPEQVHVVSHKSFFWPMYWAKHLEEFFCKPGSEFCTESFCAHLWQSFTWPYLEQLTEDHIITTQTEFCSLTRPYLEAAPTQ